MDTEAVQEPKLSCGLVVFRGVELAYLNIGGEQMLSLAQLLSTFFPVTPRTTLFTRMEKIQARRHFCNGAEIKLLKTVGGCHGSSANCTVIPKADVDNYCSTYLDPASSHVKDVKGQAVEQFSNKHDTKSRPTKSMKSPKKNNKELQPLAESSKLVTIQHEHNSSFKSKRKKKIIADRTVSVSFIEDKPQMTINTRTGNSLNEFAANGMNLEDISARGEIENDHVTSSSTQTPSMLNRVLKTKKSPKMNVDERSNNRTGIKQRSKRPLSAGCDKEKLYPPSKLHVSETVDCKPLIRKELGFCHLAVSEVEKLSKLPLHSVVSEVRSPFSDVSSNDSGFSSTTPKKVASSKNGMVSKLDEVYIAKKKPPPFLHVKKDSPLNKVKRSPKKEIEKELVKVEENASLSPPALVIRRCENTWQVETKTNKEIVENVKKKLKLGKSTKLKAKAASKNPTDKVITEKQAIEISTAVLPDQNFVTSPQQQENKILKRNVTKLVVNNNAEQIECQSKNQEALPLPVVNEQTPRVDEDSCEGPLKDLGIFPMKRRRRRRSKLEMRELRLRQAAKKTAKLSGQPITEISITTDQNMNRVPNLLSLKKKRKKKKLGKKISSEKKASESAETNISQSENVALNSASVNSVEAKGEPVTLSESTGTVSHLPDLEDRESTDPENHAAQPKRSRTGQFTPVKLAPVKPALKTNSKFRLNDWFAGFPMLAVQNGSIRPAYTHVYAAENKPPGPDHVVWKWQLGCPVVDKAVDKVQYKVKKIRQKKLGMNASNSVVAKARVCKAKKLAKAKSKMNSSTKPALTISASTSGTKFNCVEETSATSSVNVDADSSTNIDVTEKLQSCQWSCTSTLVSHPSSPQKSLSLCSPVHLAPVLTPSLVTVQPINNIIDFADSVPSSTITHPP